jgi:DNA replication protein DnaC
MKNEEFTDKWERCLQMIAGKVSPHVFDTWFKDIILESYDPQQGAVLLDVPHAYVYEYLEEVQAALLKESLDAAFGTVVRLSYRIRKEQAPMPVVDFQANGQIPRLAFANARERLENGLKYFLGDKARWLPCYDKVADWLCDNKGRGLLCVGTPGLGKTLICEKILPVIFGRSIRTVTAQEMVTHIDELKKERCVIIDDLGKEPAEATVKFVRRRPFFELCDAAERNGILLIITTNLSTTAVNNPIYPDSIERHYGQEVISRLRATTSVVIFKGPDQRNT